jgi:hypothetical protein
MPNADASLGSGCASVAKTPDMIRGLSVGLSIRRVPWLEILTGSGRPPD